MSKNSTEFNGLYAALDYIKVKGYASYSSLVNVKNCTAPSNSNAKYFDIGTETHARFLEKITTKQKDKEDEILIKNMVKSLESNKMVSRLMEKAEVEVEFLEKVNGLMCKGYIDILPPAPDIGDLKTTRHRNLHQFAANMNFLQAALYMRAKKRKNFFYIGIQKEAPFNVFIFNVVQYPARLKEADELLTSLIKQVKKATGL